MNQGEQPGVLHFPDNGLRATNVPMETLEVQGKSGLLVPDQNDPFDLAGEINNRSFQKIRSAVIFSDVDLQLKGWTDQPFSLQAGFNPLQQMPATESFKLDLDLDLQAAGTEVEPAEASLQLMLFNTREPLLVPSDLSVRSSRSVEGVDVDATSWQTAMLVPGAPYRQQTFYFQNTGSNELEYRVNAITAGTRTPQELNNAGNTVLSVASGDPETVNVSLAAPFLELQVRESTGGNSTTIDGQYSGEA